MKIVLSLLFILLFSMQISAQRIGMEGGLAISELTNIENGGRVLGLTLGFIFDMMPEEKKWHLYSGLRLTQKQHLPYFSSENTPINQNCIEIPIDMAIHFPTNKHYFFVNGGIYTAMNLSYYGDLDYGLNLGWGFGFGATKVRLNLSWGLRQQAGTVHKNRVIYLTLASLPFGK